MDRITLSSERLLFLHDLSPPQAVPLLTKEHESNASEADITNLRTQILLWSPPTALCVNLALSKIIHLDKAKSIDIAINNGRNHIQSGKIALRAGSAGLRLLTGEAKAISGDVPIDPASQPGQISFGEVLPEKSFVIRILYTLETEARDITVKSEVSYNTAQGNFVYGCQSTLSIVLPVSVNVQDSFQHDALFSRFTVGAAGPSPLRLIECHLHGNEDYNVESLPLPRDELDVFLRQPLSLLSRITRKSCTGPARKGSQLRTNLSLEIGYRCLNHDIRDIVGRLFDSAIPTGLRDYSHLLSSSLAASLSARCMAVDLDAALVSQEFEVGTSQHYNWERTLLAIPPDDRVQLTKFVTGWHEVGIAIGLLC